MPISQLVIFDFDWSLADQDTDRYVCEVLAPDLRRKLKNRTSDQQWTDLVTDAMVQLHKRGISREQIERSLQTMPFHPAMVRAVTALQASSESTRFLCLSNANAVFINTILKERGLTNLFDEIITNPAEWTSDGLLKVRRRIDLNGPQHDCKIGCSPNMCKGDELTAYLARCGRKFDRLIYVGDGSNDFCPILRFGTNDITFVRRYRGLERKIKFNASPEGPNLELKPTLKWWAGAWELEEYFNELAEENRK